MKEYLRPGEQDEEGKILFVLNLISENDDGNEGERNTGLSATEKIFNEEDCG